MRLIIVMFASLLAAGVAGAAPYSCGPFLLQPGPDRMTVVIDHEAPVPATLTYGIGSGQEKTVRHDEPQRHHIFALEGLEPGTEYRYEIRSGRTLRSGEHRFRTLPDAPRRYQLLALGDVRSRPEVWHRLSQRIQENETEALFVIGTGDYPADGSQYDQWVEQFFAPGRALLGRLPFWPAIGNHERTGAYEDESEQRSHFFTLFDLPGNERWYRVDYRYTTLLVVDSNSQMGPGSLQYDWLREQLRSERRRFTLAAFHHDPVTSGSHGRRHPDGTSREWQLDQLRRFVMPLLEIYGVDLVLNGHDHFYERSFKDGVYYVVTGGGGAPLYAINSIENRYQQVASSTNHYVSLDIRPESIALTAIDADGEIIDWFKIPLSAAALERRRYYAAARLEQALEPAGFDVAGKRTVVPVENPLGFPLQVAVQSLDGEGKEPVSLVLEPGARQTFELDLPELFAELEKPAWRGRIEARLAIDAGGDDDGLPVEMRIERGFTLREASYGVKRMEAPVVDGELNEWGGVPSMVLDDASITVHNRDSYTGERDMRALVRLGWSAAHLHLGIEVRDDRLVDVASRPTWENDSVEIYFDGRPESERTDRYEDRVSQNIFPALRSVAAEFEGNRSWPAAALEWKVKRTERGYGLEASIPYALLRGEGSPEAGQTLRFDLMVNDRDSPEEEQSHHRLWSRSGASSNTSGFGLLVLEE